jgi:polar amino acid transport system substrate-binding protein
MLPCKGVTVKIAKLLLFAALLGGSCASSVAEPLREVTISTFPAADDPLFVVCRKIMEEAYRRLGIKMNVLTMPGERSLIMANSGKTDGELCRKKDALQSYKNLVMVAPPLIRVDVVAFSFRKLDIRSWSDLAKYKIGYERGTKSVEQNTQGMNVDAADTMEQGLRRLKTGLVDVYVDAKVSVLYRLKQLGYYDFYMSPPLNTHTDHHYLNVRNAALVGKLEEVLGQMQKEGAFARIESSVTGADE